MAPSQQGNAATHPCDECTMEHGDEGHPECHCEIHMVRDRGKVRRRRRYKCVHCRRKYVSDEKLQSHINDYHFKETDERHACERCLLYKLPCRGDPCQWCKLDGKAADCVIVVPHTAAPEPSQEQVQIKGEWSPADDMSIRQGESGSAPGHVSIGWSTPRPNSPTDAILSLPSRPLPSMYIDTGADSLPPSTASPGEVNIQAGSLSWLDFEVTYSEAQELYIRRLIGGDSHTHPPREPSDVAPLDASLVVAVDSLGHLFKTPYVPQSLELSELILVPGIELLGRLVNNYFLEWQKAQPVLHVATWRFVECPMVMLGAIACIGAVFDEDAGIVHQARHISERCVSELNITATGCPQNGLDIMYLAAVCLHLAYLLGSGDERIHSLVSGVRTYLIDSLRSLRLLGAGMSGQDGPAQVLGETTRPEEAEWAAWIAREFEIRTTWAVFEVDCTFSLLTNRPCAIDLRDLPSRFPCSDELYDASDAHSWAELRCQSPYRAQGPMVSTVVAATAAKTVTSDHISPWSKRLCTQVLERIFRGYMRQRDSTVTAAQHHGLDPGSVATERTESLLWSISFLGKSIHDTAISGPLSTKELINFSATKLIRHYTHLTVYSDAIDLIAYIARVASSHKSPNCRTSLRWAQQKLIERFAVHPYKSRQHVWHAGQMIRIAKICAIFTPCDNLRIFTAYLTILAFAKYGPRSVRDADGVEPFLVDEWPHGEHDVESWLQGGGPAQIGSCTRIQVGCRTDEIIHEAFQLLYRPKTWRISERFFNILVHFNELDVID